MNRTIIIILGILLISTTSFSQTYPNNEDGQYEDMLTPAYYLAPNGDAFRNEINKFVHFARLESFQHPLKNSVGQMPQFTTNREFGDQIGPAAAAQHHPAIDLHIGNDDSLVNLYAAYDGYVEIYRDAPKYRHYLSITKNIEDSIGSVIGKMVTLYAHIDLDLDSIDNILLDGQFVNQGDIVSRHLYSGTMGGPHLHFEIRYYRQPDIGNEEFYGIPGGPNPHPNYTEPSEGPWTYGYWDPNIGYGFANPENHLNDSLLGIISNDFEQEINYYPNPTKGIVTIELKNTYQELGYSIYNINGKIIEQKYLIFADLLEINLTDLNSGIYMIILTEKRKGRKAVIRVIKE